MKDASNTAPWWPLSVETTAKPRASAGTVPIACGPSGGRIDPFKPPPPWNRKRPFQRSGSAIAKPIA
jgi:hypothetical protein